jgi:protein-S-isoprenylcysteine O-methyltransferase Ste14
MDRAIGRSSDRAIVPSRDHAIARSHDLGEVAGKAVIVSLFTMLAVRLGIDYLETGRLTGLLLLASEALVVVLTLFRRAPALVDRGIRARGLTVMSLLGPLLMIPSSLSPLAPEAVTVAVSAIGLSVVIAGKVSLGRSFGLMPANRGIVCTGLYQLVRHPIYMGYLITHVAFLAANPSLWNIVALATADLALMARAVCEEATLARDARYREYQTRVRWRVVPGVF